MIRKVLFAAAGCAVLFLGCARPLARNPLHIGIWAAQANLWDEAIFRWQKVLDKEPNSAAAHNNLAVAYEMKSQWDEARKEYETALKLAPNNTEIKFNLARFKENLEPKAEDATKKKKSDDEEKDKT